MGQQRRRRVEAQELWEEVFERLVRRVRPRLVRFLTRNPPWRLRPHEAEDIVQTAFLRAWELRDGFNPLRGRLDGWLFRICVNVARDWSATWKQQLLYERSYPPQELAQIAAVTGTSEESVSAPSSAMTVRAAMVTLSQRDQRVLMADACSDEKVRDRSTFSMYK